MDKLVHLYQYKTSSPHSTSNRKWEKATGAESASRASRYHALSSFISSRFSLSFHPHSLCSYLQQRENGSTQPWPKMLIIPSHFSLLPVFTREQIKSRLTGRHFLNSLELLQSSRRWTAVISLPFISFWSVCSPFHILLSVLGHF